MTSVSKKKLEQKNKFLSTKLKEKNADKVALKRRLKQNEETVEYWENMHAKSQEQLAGRTLILTTNTLYQPLTIIVISFINMMSVQVHCNYQRGCKK